MDKGTMPSWRLDSIRACVRELRDEAAAVEGPAGVGLRSKIDNLEESLFDQEDWAASEDGEPVLKLAMIGPPMCGQQELLSSFLCGGGNGHKSPMQLLTGVKAPKFSSVGKKSKTLIPCNGRERTLLIHNTSDDPSPMVLAWADAFLLVFSTADAASFARMQVVWNKIRAYRRVEYLPALLVGVEGVHGDVDVVSDKAAYALVEGWDSCLTYVKANPELHVNVDRLFHDLVHEIVEFVLPQDRAVRVGKMASSNTSTPSRQRPLASSNPHEDLGVGRSIPVKQGILRKLPTAVGSVKGHGTKRWAVLTSGTLTYYHSTNEYMTGHKPGKSINLAQTTVKIPMLRSRGASSRQGTPLKAGSMREKLAFPFQIVSLDNKNWQFYASSESDRKEWMTAIEKEIFAGISQMSSAGVKNNVSMSTQRYAGLTPEQRSALLAVDGNGKCADCGCTDPVWASINLGVLLCIECSGIHRNIGVHITRVRSLDLDDWNPSQLAVLMEAGNAVLNTVWEAAIPSGESKPLPGAERAAKEAWIHAKYVRKQFLGKASEDGPGPALVAAIASGSGVERFSAIAHCGADDVNYNMPDTGRTALHEICAQGDVMWAQMLVWAGADVNALDALGHSPLFDAKAGGHTKCAELLVEAGCIGSGGTATSTATAAPPRQARSKIRSTSSLITHDASPRGSPAPEEAGTTDRKRRAMPPTPGASADTSALRTPAKGSDQASSPVTPTPSKPAAEVDFFSNLASIVSPKSSGLAAPGNEAATLDFFNRASPDLDKMPHSAV